MAFVIYVENGLDAKCTANQGGGTAESAASLQEEQVIYGEPVDYAELDILCKCSSLF